MRTLNLAAAMAALTLAFSGCFGPGVDGIQAAGTVQGDNAPDLGPQPDLTPPTKPDQGTTPVCSGMMPLYNCPDADGQDQECTPFAENGKCKLKCGNSIFNKVEGDLAAAPNWSYTVDQSKVVLTKPFDTIYPCTVAK